MKGSRDMVVNHLFWLVVAVSMAAFNSGGNAAESAKLMPLRLAYSAITVNQAIPWISLDAGHFKKHGLDVELVHASSITALQALLAGEVTIVQSATDGAVSSNLSGADTVFMGAILDKPLYSFIVEFQDQDAARSERQESRGHPVRCDTGCSGARHAQNVGVGSGDGCVDDSTQ